MHTTVQFDRSGICYRRKNQIPTNTISPCSLGMDTLSIYVTMTKYFLTLWLMSVIVMVYLFWNQGILLRGVIAIVLTLAFLLFLLPKRILHVTYMMDADSASKWDGFRGMVSEMCSRTTLWEVLDSSVNANSKYHGGAVSSVDRGPIATKTIKANRKTGLGLNIRFNIPTLLLQSRSHSILFIPDGLVVQAGTQIATYTYDELSIDTSVTRFVDTFPVAHDAEIVGYTWQYVNRDGSPDARFKDNYQAPICIYGKMIITGSGHTFTVQTSGKTVARDFAVVCQDYTEYVSSVRRLS